MLTKYMCTCKGAAVRKCAYVDLNAKVYEWFSTARAKNIPLTGRLLQENASMFAVEMGHKDFTASKCGSTGFRSATT